MKTRKQKNEFTHDGTTAIVDISTPTHPEARMLIDLVDWLAILKMGGGRVYCWREAGKHTSYALAYIDGKPIRIHRLLLPESEKVDHISRDGLDNRRSNVRAATSEVNGRNARKRCDNTSGTTGVRWHNATGKWQANINFNKKLRHLGCYAKKSDAIAARRAAEVEHGYMND